MCVTLLSNERKQWDKKIFPVRKRTQFTHKESAIGLEMSSDFVMLSWLRVVRFRLGSFWRFDQFLILIQILTIH